MKAVFLDFNSLNQNDLEISRLQQQFDQLTLHAVTAPDEVLERVQNADVIITNKVRVNAELIRQLPKLKLILISATGTNNVDLSAACEHNIVVCNCQGYGTPAVAQHTLLLMLSLATSFLKYDRAVRTGAWNKAEQFCLLDFPIVELAGKTLGIVGYGELGQAVARLAEAFGMQVKIASLPCRPGGTDRIPLKELLPQVDFLSLHCPLTEQTQNLIGAAELQQMKPTAFLINCARGGLANETALVQALKMVKSPELPAMYSPLSHLNRAIFY